MFREQQKRLGVHADIVTSLRPLTSYSRTPVRGHVMAPFIYFFINRHTKAPTLGGWCLLALAFFFVIHCGLISQNLVLLRSQSNVNPKFQPFLPVAPQEEEFRAIAENNLRGDDLLVLPLFDPNKHVKGDVDVLDEEKKKKIRESRPQPKSFPVALLRTPSPTCVADDVSLLLIVLSRAEHSATRQFIRQTWGKYEDGKFDVPINVKWTSIFVIGKSEKYSAQVNDEITQHADVLQGDFDDNQYEDTRKFMMAITWVSQHLKHCKFRFVFKTEDNIFHNMASISAWLNVKYATHMNADKHLYLGKLIRNDRPIRDENNPLFIPVEDYPDSLFPDFIMGPVYLFSFHTFITINELLPNVTPIAMEDAFVGLLVHSSGSHIRPKHNDHFQMLSKPVETCHYLRMFFVYNVLPSEHLLIFRKMEEHRLNKQCLDARDAIAEKHVDDNKQEV